MIIKRDFAPITITLSTKEDLALFKSILYTADKNNSPVFRSSSKNELQQMIESLLKALG